MDELILLRIATGFALLLFFGGVLGGWLKTQDEETDKRVWLSILTGLCMVTFAACGIGLLYVIGLALRFVIWGAA